MRFFIPSTANPIAWIHCLVLLFVGAGTVAAAQDAALPPGAITQIVQVTDPSPVVAFLPDNTLVTAERETIHIWDPLTGKPLRQLRWVKQATFPRFALSPDGKTIAIVERGEIVRLFDLASGVEKQTLLHGFYVTALAFSANGVSLATAAQDHGIRIWNVASGKKRSHFPKACDWNPIFYLAFTPDGRSLVSASMDRTAAIWDLSSGRRRRQIGTYIPDKSGAPVINAATLSADGTMFATCFMGGDEPGLRLWDVSNGKLIAKLNEHVFVRGMAFSPNGKFLAVAGTSYEDKERHSKIVFLDVATGKAERTLSGQDPLVYIPMAFSANGKLLATASERKSIVIWDVSPNMGGQH